MFNIISIKLVTNSFNDISFYNKYINIINVNTNFITIIGNILISPIIIIETIIVVVFIFLFVF